MTDTEMIGGQEPSKHNVAQPVVAAPQVVAGERAVIKDSLTTQTSVPTIKENLIVPFAEAMSALNHVRTVAPMSYGRDPRDVLCAFINLAAAPVQPEAVPDGDLPTDPIGCAGYLAGMAFGNCPADEIGHCVSIITAALPAPAAQGDAKELADAEYKEGEPGWRPACCNRSGDGPCCDIGYCAADKERADIQSGK